MSSSSIIFHETYERIEDIPLELSSEKITSFENMGIKNKNIMGVIKNKCTEAETRLRKLSLKELKKMGNWYNEKINIGHKDYILCITAGFDSSGSPSAIRLKGITLRIETKRI